MKPVKWGRLITAMLTPFDRDGEVNYKAAGQLANHLVETGTDTVLVGGTTGESPSLEPKERGGVLEAVLTAVGDRAQVIAGTGTNSTRDSIKLTKEAEVVGAHGVMLVTPYYNKPPQAGLIEHFSLAAKATRLPVLLYNVPGRTSINMLPATVARLAAVDNIVAVKEASGDLEQVTEIVRQVPPDFLVYSGDDSLTLPILSVGGHGVVSVAAHVAGRQVKQLIQLHLAGDNEAAAMLHRALAPVVVALFMTTNPIPVKAATNMIGIPAGRVRPPLCDLTEKETEILRRVMREAGLLDEDAAAEGDAH